MADAWRLEIRQWAQEYAQQMAGREGILGVIIGGSIARGKEWRHSDLELGILVEQRNPGIAYFNVDQGRGVELIQVVLPELREQMRMVEDGDLSAAMRWPIQLWLGQVVADPSGELTRFKRLFDAALFSEAMLALKRAEQKKKIEKILAEARGLFDEGRPAAALVRARLAVNEAILGLHWRFGELPRSQNRTDSRLRMLCARKNAMSFYAMYRDAFGLDETDRAARLIWPRVRPGVLEITRRWGDSARDFFDFAVDSHFAWRQRAGILTVYRLYIPIIGAEGQRIIDLADDSGWQVANTDLAAFLGLRAVSAGQAKRVVDRLENACREYDLI